MKIVTEVEIPDSRVCDIMVNSFEGGSKEWVQSADHVGWVRPEGASNLVWWGQESFWAQSDYSFQVEYDYPLQ